MITIKLFEKTGLFAENKDVARDIRIKEIIPELEKNEGVVLDFENIEGATQSFIHALISDLFRKYGNDVLEKITFKSCNETVQKIIEIVTDYMQESE
ncbi:MAG: STAS-like domain-containing protein [Candidatus Pacebacteria bacterium]|nr:STAS-like domain-containing protein [Candidatus Paceibacterota bacterium]